MRALPLLVLLAACGPVPRPSVSFDAGPARGPAEAACLRAVQASTMAAEVELLSSDPVEGGAVAVVGAGRGEARVAWRCLGRPDGTASGLQPLAGGASVPAPS